MLLPHIYARKLLSRILLNLSGAQEQSLTLHCPFCNAEEDTRVEAVDHEGKSVVLVMFGCPFSYKFALDEMGSDADLQRLLNDWRKTHGDSWLRSLGPVIMEREMRGIKRFEESQKNN